MNLKSLFIKLHPAVLSVLCLLFPASTSAQHRDDLAGLTVDDKIVIRFLFTRLQANYVLPPVIFRVAEPGSSNWNTAPVDQYGRSPYISLANMKSLVHVLENNHLSWQSVLTEPLEPFENIYPNKDLLISVYASNGMATASVSPKQICRILAQANRAN